MRQTLLVSILLLLSVHVIFGQVPVATHVQILKAEDSRRYDKVLEDLIKSPNAAVRLRAALATGRIGDAAAVPALVKMLNDSSEKVREMAAFALGEIESIEAADAIRIALGETARAQMPGDEKANVRGRLVEAAGKIVAANVQAETRAAASVPEKNKALRDAIIFSLERELRSKSDPNKETILLGLTAALRARPENADVTVKKFLASTDPDIVSTALNTLTRLRAKNANKEARDLLETNTNAVVRANAARVLGAAEDKEAVDLLIKAATKDVDGRVRVSAIRSLAALKDPKAAEPLLTRGEQLLAGYSKAKKPNFLPDEQSEFAEVATTLGRLHQDTANEGAIALLERFRKVNGFRSPEVEIALARVSPPRYINAINLTIEGEGYVYPLDKRKKRYANWKVLSAIAQGIGAVASMEIANPNTKDNALSWLNGILETSRDPRYDRRTFVLALPDVYQAIAKFKPTNLGELAREALKDQDVVIRTAAAGIIGDLPESKENIAALERALNLSIQTDHKSDDAVLAILEALGRFYSLYIMRQAYSTLGDTNYLVRKKTAEVLLKKGIDEDPQMKPLNERVYPIRPYRRGDKNKLGVILNTDIDYRRALSRKNGGISAVLTTQKGTFTIELLPEEAPLTVDNFVKLARAGYFNGLEVHRVVPNFVMQDGDPRGDGNGGPGWSIRCEVNMVPYERGAVGMALSGKDTGGSQWFVTHSPQPHLDGGYTVFGRVNPKGMEVVDKIVRGDKILTVKIIGR